MLREAVAMSGETFSLKPPAMAPIMFDPQRRAATPELQAAIKSLIGYLEQREDALSIRQRARKEADRAKFHLAIEAIACNLAGPALKDPLRMLAVPRRNGVMWAQGRYSNPVYGQHFLDALTLMANPEVSLIEEGARGYRFANGDKQSSTVRPTTAFTGHIPQMMMEWDSFIRAEEPEVLILKGPKDSKSGRSDAIAYSDTALTRRRRKQVQRINRVLEAAPLRLISGGGGELALLEDGQPIDPTRRSLRRIFNNGDWQQGGRLFDGFWENMRRADRFRLLRIGTAAHPEGEPVANVDFGQLFPTLAYLKANCEPPEGDLYDIIGDGTHRDGWKQLINALLFATERMTRWPQGASSMFPKGAKLSDAIALIRHVHAPIAHLFGMGIGFNLMLIESEILIVALEHLAHVGITALPLHDSVLVAGSQAKAAEAIMAEAFGVYAANARAKLKVDFGV